MRVSFGRLGNTFPPHFRTFSRKLVNILYILNILRMGFIIYVELNLEQFTSTLLSKYYLSKRNYCILVGDYFLQRQSANVIMQCIIYEKVGQKFLYYIK